MATLSRRTKDSAYSSSVTQERSYETLAPITGEPSYAAFFQRGSISASSDSASSSPTAPRSTSETPGTSPDTPAFAQSYSYPSLSSSLKAAAEGQVDLSLPPSSSPRKARNLKNLALNTSCASQFGRSISTASLPMENEMDTPNTPSVPFTSSFVKPASSRRKGSALNLTIKTPPPEPSMMPEPFPQTPALRLTRPAVLRQTQSTEAVAFKSPGYAPQGGMTLPSINSRLAPAPIIAFDDECQDYQGPESREAKPEAYPNGPICIYDPQVYLYLEPSAEEAADYDVIFNVASEVPNPFSTRVESVTLKAAVEAIDRQSVRESKAKTQRHPEYIHVPWEHNTDIVPDLYELVKVVDDRVQSGKRVLIHCQCGVSRSASLIVAYGIYKNPSVTVQQAYDAVKQKSQWIGPNMNLIMQLQEFRSGLMNSESDRHKPRLSHTQSERISERKSRSGRSATESHPTGRPHAPQTAPLSRINLKHTPMSINTSNLEHVSPGPSSAPVEHNWPTNQTEIAASSQHTQKAEVPEQKTIKKPTRPSPPVLNLGLANTVEAASVGDIPTQFAMAPVMSNEDPSFGITSPREERFGGEAQFMFGQRFTQPLPTPRSTEFGMTALQPIELFDTATLGLTSPREATFTTDLPHRLASTSSRHTSLKSSQETHLSSRHTSKHSTSSGSKYTSSREPKQLSSSSSSSSTPKASSSSSSKHTSTSKSKESSTKSFHREQRRPTRLPISTTTTNSIDETLFSPRTTEFSHNPLENALPAPSSRSKNVFPDELMSPRATEFTENPFHEPLSTVSRTKSNRTSKSGGSRTDPRSPPIKGAHPINRNIADVL